MQQRFLAVAQNLHNPSHLTGLWLAHSDEPLTLQWLVDACRPHWQAHQQIIKRIELNSAKDWQLAISDLQSMSLFAEHFAIIISGKHKPDDVALSALSQFAQDVNRGETAHHLIWLLPKQDKKAQTSKAFTAFSKNGLIIDANLYQESDRKALLQFKATELGVMLTANAWQILLEHTEQDLLTAHQNLWQLSLTHANQTIDENALLAILTQGGHFSVFDLGDAILQQNPKKALTILTHLQQTDTAPSLVLWAIAKEARLIANLHAGKTPDSLGIWRNKATLYQRLAHSTTTTQSNHWLMRIYQADQSIKGIIRLDTWLLLKQLVLNMCRLPILTTTRT